MSEGRGRRLGWAAFCVCLLALGACRTPPEVPPPAPAAPSSLPPPAAEAVRYAVRSDLSDVRFLVYRAGPLAALGHNHVVQPATITGDIHLARDFGRSSFSLTIPVADLRVDVAEARAVEGEEFATPPDADAIAGTTRNMLGARVLDAERHPQIEIRSVGLAGPAWAPDVTVRISLRGAVRELRVPVAIEQREERLAATAVFEIRQSDFGITPLSVLGGALQVADTVRVRMRIVAQKA